YNWFNTSALGSSNTEWYTGSHSFAVTSDSSGDSWGIQRTSVSAIAGQSYTYSMWVYSVASDTLHASVSWDGATGFFDIASVSVTAGQWTHLSGTLVAPAGTTA